MAKPFGSDSAANKSGSNTTNEEHLWSWFSDDSNHAAARDSRVQTHLSFEPNDPGTTRQRVLDEFLQSKRDALRQSRFNDESPDARKAEGAAQTDKFTLTNLELTNNKPQITEARAEQKATQPTVAETRDLGFAAIRQLEGPNSASSRWMAEQRPDLAAQFKSQDCSLQMGSKPDGTVFEVLTTPQGTSRMLYAKGSTTVEIINDREGRELFKNSSRGTTSTRNVLSA